MAIKLSVSDVRQEIWRAAGPSSHPSLSTALLGQMFHEVFAELVGEGPGNLDVLLQDLDADRGLWSERLRQEAYRLLVFPRLHANRAVLADATGPVLHFWNATRALCDWLCDLRWHWTEEGLGDGGHAEWIRPEQTLTWEFRRPGWTDAVELTGVADALVRRPDGAWCVVELKLGETAPEADLAQSCLYHQMQLVNTPGTEHRERSALTLVHFGPTRRETLYGAADLREPQQKLIELIGALTQSRDVAQPTGDKTRTPDPLLTREPIPDPAPVDAQRVEQLGKDLVRAFSQYSVSVQLDGAPLIGPTFIRYPLRLGRGVRVSQATRLTEEIQVALHLDEPPFIGTMQGGVVVDVQRPDRRFVSFASVRNQFPQLDPRLGSSSAPIGVNLAGKLEFVDFSNPASPHLLVAGTTASGKSEWIIAALAGLMASNTSETLQFALIDPKRNAFLWMQDSPFLWRPIVFNEAETVIRLFEDLVDEMERRYSLFQGDDSLATYRLRTGEPLPRIVCVCDEYFDLIAGSNEMRREIERQITRLGAKARAAGIHLILATQQPSRRVISGVLDVNLPARVALKTSQAIESRMMLGESGAECLLGKGDLLFKDIGRPRRFQAIYLSPEERKHLSSLGSHSNAPV